MKFFFLFTFLCATVFHAQDATKYRTNWMISNNDKSLCENMLEELQDATKPTLVAYLGAYQMMMAKHLLSPISKLKSFKRGRENLEKAIKADANNVESRMLRLVIQKNAPKFLGYNKNMEEDKTFLKAHLDQLSRLGLKDEYEKLAK